MANEKYILLETFCEHTHIEGGFVKSLHEYGLISFEKREEDFFIGEDDIPEIEKMFRLHNDLGINLEGLDVIKRMLMRMHEMEVQMNSLRKRLKIYE